MQITPRLIFLIAFVTGLAAFLYWDREKVTRHYIIFYRRTERGLDFIDRVAKKMPRFWKHYGTAAAISGIASVVVSAVLIGGVIKKMIVTRSVENGPSLLLPGLVSQNQFQAGVSFIPVEYWVIGVGVLMFVHEMSHGIVARAEDFELNAVGWVVMGILPGAFVEPKGENMLPGDDADASSGGMWDQGSWKSRLKVLGAGSFANYLTAALFLLSGVAVSGAVTQSGGTQLVYSAQPGFPAYEQGMRQGILQQVNGVNVSTIAQFRDAAGNISVGENVSFTTSEGEFTVTAIDKKDEAGGYIGIRYGEVQNTVVKPEFERFQGGLQWFVSLLWTVGLLNLMIGLFNMLPIKPLDGGLMAETLIERYLGEEKIGYLDSFSGFGWLVILGSVIAAVIGF
ncbi:MAG: site-2 protease family protein [Candidatus Nanohaloarchaea archaeon]